MKLKGISILEQHVEKAVLLLFGLFAIGVFVMQFDLFGPSNAVEIGGKSVRPEQAVGLIRQKAQSLKGRMESGGEELEIPDPPGILEKVEKEMQSPVMPARMASLGLAKAWSTDVPVSPGPAVTNVEGGLDNPYMEITPPAPEEVYARAFAGTIDPLEPATHPNLAAFLPAAQPFDKRAVSVQGTFDASELRAMLEAVPAEQNVNPLPRAWWSGRVEILDVELIRQEVLSDGTFGAETVVPALPGRFSMRDRLTREATAPRDLPDVLRDERDRREEIRRPSFYAMIAGEAWERPSKSAARGEENPLSDEIKDAVTRYRNLAREREDFERRIKQMEEAGSSGRDDGISPRQRPRGPRGQVGGEGGGGVDDGRWPSIPSTWLAQGRLPGKGNDEDDSSEDRRQRQREARLKSMRERLGRLNEEIDALVSRMADDLGVDPDGNPLESEEEGAPEEPLTSLTGTDAPETVTVWAHDMGVEPGRSYRYKLRVRVTNPLFGNAAQVPESQRDLAMEPAIESADSAWTDVVETYPQRVYFVSSALEAAEIGAGLRREAQASVSVYEFFYGYWRGGTAALRAGDQVRVSVELPELPVWAITPGEDGKEPEVGEKTTLPTGRTVSEWAMLVEVGLGLGRGGQGQVHEVIFGRPEGGLELRVAEEDTENPLAGEVWASSERGAEAEIAEPGSGGIKGGGRRRSRPGERDQRDEPGNRPMVVPRPRERGG